MEFFMGGKLDQVTLVASPFLDSLAEVAVAHVLLEAAVVAEGRLRADEDDLAPRGRRVLSRQDARAKYFASYVLPQDPGARERDHRRRPQSARHARRRVRVAR
jgi:hypothetical protein